VSNSPEKTSREPFGPERSAVPPSGEEQQDRDGGAAVLTPPPGESTSLASGQISDAPKRVDQPFDSPPTQLSASDAPTLTDTEAPHKPGAPPDLTLSQRMLPPGAVLGHRYEIVAMLGEGGMGAVYKATDRELNRPVALKVIRPELARHKAIIERFKQELLLARQVTHKNVIRIYDLGEADHIKFITMEYVEGETLRSVLLRNKKLAPEEAVDIIQQVCRALDAAHSASIIHRDLKPQNVMRDKTGRIVVMDFGLARTFAGEGMTQTGAQVGTLDYMSPEQALAENLDQRSDLYAVGLIFYELLTGKMPFPADGALASLIKRTRERPVPVSDLDGTIPSSVSIMVSKCLERDASLRYQSAAELLADLEAWQGNRAGAALSFHAKVGPWGQSLPWPRLAAIATVMLLAALSWLWRDKLLSPVSRRQVDAGPQVSLAILPFHNGSGDPSLDWLGPSLAEMLSTDVGQSAQLRTVSQDRLHQVLSDLRVTSSTVFDPTMVGRIAQFSSADTVVWGQYAKFGDQIRVDATLKDLKRDHSVSLKIDNVSERDIPSAVDRLAENVRQNLFISKDILSELKASSYQPTSKSPEALRAYDKGLELLREGKNLDALKSLQAATTEDTQFALAFANLGEAYSRLGYDDEAEEAARKAVELSESLPPAEKYLITANHFRIAKDYPKAIASYQNLAKVSPDNPDIQSALGGIYENSGDFAKAREFYQKILAVNPKDVATLLAMGRVEILSGNDQASLDPLNRALSLAIAMDNQEQKGTILHVLGAAYSDLNKPDDALQYYKQALEIRQRLGQKKGIADGLNQIAQTYGGLGKSDLAYQNYNGALQIYREIGDRQDTGAVLVNLGQFQDDHGKLDDALKLFKESLQIQRDVHNQDGEALCLNNIGNTYLAKGDYDNARIYFEQALQLRENINVPSDIATTLHNLAEVSTKSGQYDQALSQYMRALQLFREAHDLHGTAMEGFSIGTVFEYQGRYGSAVSSKKQAVDDFRSVQEHSFWMGEALSGYGNALSEAGQFDAAAKSLGEALNLARELKNDDVIAEILNRQGDNAFYRGDLASANALYEQALRTASKTTDKNVLLLSKVDLAKAEIAEGQSQNALKLLKGILEERNALGLYLAIDCSIYEAQARMQMKDNSVAQQLLERAILQSEKSGISPLLLRAHFLLGESLRENGKPADATSHYRRALDLLESMRKDPGADSIMQRADFKTIYSESERRTHEQS
jgi:eukaryotic-like serine/threonine-protein kinase